MIIGQLAAQSAHFYRGDLINARGHADQLVALYSEERHAHLVRVLNDDPKTNSLSVSALSAWMLGYPERALSINGEADAHARRRGHPFELGCALTTGGKVLDCLGMPDEVLMRVEEADRVGRENSLPMLTECLVPHLFGIALIRKGQVAEGLAMTKRGLALWEASGGRFYLPQTNSVMAEGMAQLGDLEGALALVDEAVAQVERPGWEERWYHAETLRIKGWILSLRGDPTAAERAYIASIEWARTQQAKSWELRTATSYARLMRDQGRIGEAYELLAPVYGWFVEGFDTTDLKEAKALLAELA
jgi:predicted ATPase